MLNFKKNVLVFLAICAAASLTRTIYPRFSHDIFQESTVAAAYLGDKFASALEQVENRFGLNSTRVRLPDNQQKLQEIEDDYITNTGRGRLRTSSLGSVDGLSKDTAATDSIDSLSLARSLNLFRSSSGRSGINSTLGADGSGEDDAQPRIHPMPDAFLDIAYCESLLNTLNIKGLNPNRLGPFSSFKLITGTLPPGLKVQEDLGRLCGLPTELGSSFFGLQIVVSDPTQRDIPLVDRVVYYSLSVVEKPEDTDDGPLQIMNNALPDGVVGGQYYFQLLAKGGKPPYSWKSSSPPLGIQFNSLLGVFSGAPEQSAALPMLIQVQDSEGTTAALKLLFSVGQSELRLTTAVLNSAMVGVEYAQRLLAQGGKPPYQWLVTSGGLPQGLALDSTTGLLSGTPLAEFDGVLTISVVDSANGLDSAELRLFVATKALAIESKELPAATVGRDYVFNLRASGGKPPYRWFAEVPQDLAKLLSISASGTLLGSFTEPASLTFGVKVTDAVGATVQAPLTLQISAASLSIVNAAIPILPLCQTYQQQLAAEGGAPPYFWSLISGDPGKISLSQDGMISVKSTGADATSSVTFAATVQVADSTGTTASRVFTLRSEAKALGIKLPSSLSCSAGSICNFTLLGDGGCPPYRFSSDGVGLPEGIELSEKGSVTVESTSVGIHQISLIVRDFINNEMATTLALNISSADLRIVTEQLPEGQNSEPYEATLELSGGSAPYRWSYNSAIPSGLTLYALEGVIRGEPKEDGNFSISFQATDALGAKAVKVISLVIQATPLRIASTTLQLPRINAGEMFSHELRAEGGRPPYSWTFIDTSPTSALGGLQVYQNALSGIISQVGAGLTGNLIVQDSQGAQDTARLEFTVSGGKLLIISPSSLQAAVINQDYREELAATGGLPPYAWRLVSGDLPPGLTLDEALGAISGIPEGESPNSSFQIEVSDNSDQTETSTFVIPVSNNSLPPISQLLAAASMNKIGLAWDNPRVDSFSFVVIVRSESQPPAQLSDGVEIYRGQGETFVDSGLENGTTYYYAAFAQHEKSGNKAGGFSASPGTAHASASPHEISLLRRPDPFIDEVISFSPLNLATAYNAAALPGVVLGPPQAENGGIGMGASAGVVSLQARVNNDGGRTPPYGGTIVVKFSDNIVYDGPGADFIVFENPILTSGTINDFFIEPAVVEVSANGRDFFRFPFDFVPHFNAKGELALGSQATYSKGFAGVHPVLSRNGTPDPTNPAKAGGDPFDLSSLPGKPLSWIQYVRITATGDNWLRDENGDMVREISEGQSESTSGTGKSGFDLDAVSSVHY